MVDRVRQLRVLLAITFRPEFQPAWAGRSHVTSLVLNRLGERDGAALAQELAGNTVLAADIVAEIVERTDGVPLFVEELTKAVLESPGQEDRVCRAADGASVPLRDLSSCRNFCPQTSHYSITSSARASNDGGIVRPSVLAAFRLMINLTIAGC